jgi:hypothetical protein
MKEGEDSLQAEELLAAILVEDATQLTDDEVYQAFEVWDKKQWEQDLQH